MWYTIKTIDFKVVFESRWSKEHDHDTTQWQQYWLKLFNNFLKKNLYYFYVLGLTNLSMLNLLPSSEKFFEVIFPSESERNAMAKFDDTSLASN